MLCSSRLNKILSFCLEQEDYVSVDVLASFLQTSKRTIFRELEHIDGLLSEYHLHMDSRPRKGIRLCGETIDKEKLKDCLLQQGTNYLNKEERRNLLIFEILRTNEVMKMFYYANLFQVSETTISSDLDEIEPWFQKYNLKILRKPGSGIELSGNESDYRKALTSILQEKILGNPAYHAMNVYDTQTILKQIFMEEGIMKLLNQDILKRVLEVFHEFYHELNLDQYTQSSYVGLIIHLAIAIDRILKGEAIVEQPKILAVMRQEEAMIQAVKISKLLEEEFDVEMPEIEIAFIAMHIQGAKKNLVIKETDEITFTMKENQLLELIYQMIAAFDDARKEELMQDKQLLDGLMAHLKPTLIRLRFQLPIHNPLTEQLKYMYSDIFERSKLACTCIETMLKCKVSEAEIGFVAMHFGAAIERVGKEKKKQREIHVGIICSSGIGVSALMAARVKSIVDEHVVIKTYALAETEKDTESELYISTFAFEHPIKTVVVNPLLSSHDIENIHSAIQDIREHMPAKEKVSKEISDLNEISKAIFKLLPSIQMKECPDVKKEDLIHYICKDVGEGSLAIERKLKEREQKQSVIFNDFGFALFHCTGPVLKPILNFYIPNDSFKEKELMKIRYVILMVVPEKDQIGKRIMGAVSSSLLDNEKLDQAINNRNPKMLEDAMESIMKDYLFECSKENK